MDQSEPRPGDLPERPARPLDFPAASALRAHRPWFAVVTLAVCLVVSAVALARFFAAGGEPLPIALVMPLSGPTAASVRPIRVAVNQKVAEVNAAGGVAGRPIRLLEYDDRGDAEVARRVAAEVAAGPALAVIGHVTNETTAVACPTYRDAGLLAISGTATADRLTVENPYFYRLCFDDTALGWTLAVYTSRVLRSTRASILYSNDQTGLAQYDSFRKTYPIVGGEIAHRWAFDDHASPEARLAIIEELAQAVRDDDAGTVVLALSSEGATREALVALRRSGVDPIVFGNNCLGLIAFAESLRSEPEERREPGFFTRHAYATTYAIADTANDRMSAFVAGYRAATHGTPPPRAAKFAEVTMMIADALRGASTGTVGDRDAVRRAIRDRVAAFDGPKHAFTGLSGPLYFDDRQTVPEPARISRFVQGKLASAPLQIAAVQNPSFLDIEQELAAGNIFSYGVRYFWTQQVVFTGIDIQEVSAIDPAKGTFNAEFYLWFRYLGSDTILQVDMNSVGDAPAFDPQKPLDAKEVDGMKYRLYHVKGEFRVDLDFHDYPFDSQSLELTLANPRLPRESVIYAIDAAGLGLEGQRKDRPRIIPPPDWRIPTMEYAPDTRRTFSSRGDPGRFGENSETEYSGFKAIATVQRQARDFLFKQLLPLILLIIVVYLSLLFPRTLLQERVGVPITSLLASTVLQSSITGHLVRAGYTTTIEYGFYGFYLLCVFSVGVALLVLRLHDDGRDAVARRVDRIARWAYIASVLATFLVYYICYGR